MESNRQAAASADADQPAASPEDDGLRAAVDELAALRGTLLFVGLPDTGKTTLIDRVARAALDREPGSRIAIVDSDIGQSNIGPPAAVGMQTFHEAPERFRVRRPEALAFVGSIQPFGFFLEMVAGVCDLAAQARDQGADRVFVDTSGLPPTAGGFRLKEEKLRRLRPDHLVLVERRRELHPLAQLARASSFCQIHRVAVSRRAHLKPVEFRKGHRAQLMGDYFRGARTQKMSLTDIGITGSSVLSGRPLSPAARVRVAEFLKTPVIRAELAGDRLCVIAPRTPSEDGVSLLQHRFPRLRVQVLGSHALQDLLIGLEDGNGRLLDIALIQACDFTNLTLNLVSPFTDLGAVRVIRMGALRLCPDGREIGSLRPGEI